MNTQEESGTVAPAKEQTATQHSEETAIPNNFDHMVVSGLMEGTFSGPFEMDFEGNHTILIGSNGTIAVYRATRTTPVCFISKDADIHISTRMIDCEVEIHAEADGKELTATVTSLSGMSGVPVDGKWLDLEKGILEAAHQLDGIFGRRRMAAILAGSNSPSTFNGTLETLRLYGRFKRHSVTKIVRKIDVLIEKGLLKRDEEDRFPRVKLTTKGAHRMRELRQDLGVVDLAFGNPEAREADVELVEKLTLWRNEKSSKEEVPRYIVLKNDAINNISQEKPGTLEELSRVVGVGPATLENYGQEVLAVISGKENKCPTGPSEGKAEA